MLNCQVLTEKLLQINQNIYKTVKNELKKAKNIWFKFFNGKSRFEEDGIQHYLVFQSICRYFKRIAGAGWGNYIYYW